MPVTDSLQHRIKVVQENIAKAAAGAKRDPREIMLVAVTKSATVEHLKQFIDMGYTQLAESRVQQLQQRALQITEWLSRRAGKSDSKTVSKSDAKIAAIGPADVTWHMIGHLQRNKVKPVLQLVRYVHSVDSLRLAEEIQTGAAKLAQPMQMLLEVNVSGETSKYGVAVGAALHLAEQIDTMDNVQLIGLMTMAPQIKPEETRPMFARLREIFEEIRFRKIGGAHFKHLSMGMSNDYPQAIAEGATMVRIGRAIFGEG